MPVPRRPLSLALPGPAPVLVLALAAVALAGCLGAPEGPSGDDAPLAPSSVEEPRVVVAVIDTGMNLYHAAFRRAEAPVEPASADPAAVAQGAARGLGQAVGITLASEDWDAAVERDMEALMALQPRTLYHFPGTKVVGAISFQQPGTEWPLILDRPGYYTHGTMTTSRAVGEGIAIAGSDPGIDLVIVQGFNAEAVRWAGDQDWIDVVSISAGISPMTTFPLAPNLLDDGGIEAFNHAAHRKPFFASSGNGVGNTGTVGFPSWWRGSSGAPDVISVGANDNTYLSQWHNQDSYIAADGCANPAASPGDLEAVANTGGGTSSATPFSAGGGAKLLLEARRILGHGGTGVVRDEALPAIAPGWDSLAPHDGQLVLARGPAGLVPDGPLADGVFTLQEFKDVLYHTALVTPTEDQSDGIRCEVTRSPFAATYLPADAVPADQRFPFQGFGEVNQASILAAVEVLKGQAPLPARAGDDAEYARAHMLKTTWVGGAEGEVPAALRGDARPVAAADAGPPRVP